MFQTLLTAINLDFKIYIQPDHLPADMPEDFQALLLKSLNNPQPKTLTIGGNLFKDIG